MPRRGSLPDRHEGGTFLRPRPGTHLPPPSTGVGLEALEDRCLLSGSDLATAYDQYLLEMTNRARSDPAAEAARYGIDLNEGLAPGTITADPKQPLTFSQFLLDSAQGHSQWMLDTDTFSHTGQGGSTPYARMCDAGYVFTGSYGYGENIAWKGTTGTPDVTAYVADLHAAFFVDAGVSGRGHRLNILLDVYREIGVGVKTGVFTYTGTDYNSVMATEDFAYSGTSHFLTGVAYDDNLVSDDDFYTPGEGLGGISVTATRQSDGAVFTATTWSAGGYSLALEAGTYNVTASGGLLGGTVLYAGVAFGSRNVKLDFTTDMVSANQAPTLTAVNTLTGARVYQDFTITYGMLAAAADEYDADGDPISFRIESASGSGTLGKWNGASSVPVVPGTTTLSAGESLIWHPAGDNRGALDAFTVVAGDGLAVSSPAVQVKVYVEWFAVDATTLSVHGTSGDDAFTFVAGASQYRVTLGGVTKNYSPAAVTAINLYGYGGNDGADLTGGSGVEEARLYAGSGTLTGAAYSVSLTGIETQRVFGGASDTAYLYDSAGNDAFYGRPTYAYLTGAGFHSQANGFGMVYAPCTAGGTNDIAYLFDSAGNDTLYGYATYAYLTGEGFRNQAEGFDKVYAYSTAGGTDDKAYLYDSSGNDSFYGYPTYAYMAGPGFRNQPQGFDKVYACATAGGTNDVAYLCDSSGDDTFHAYPTYGYMTGTGFRNQAEGFDRLYACSTAGGSNDTANLHDSSGDDTFYGLPTYSYMKGTLFHNQAQAFDKVYAYSTAGGSDLAHLYDSSGDDSFYAYPTYGYVTGGNYFNQAQGFGKVYAHAITGGANDTAYLYDSSGNDSFYGYPAYAYMTGAGFYNYAQTFDKVYAYATAGGTGDVAYLCDSAGDETFYAYPTYGYMIGTGFRNEAQGFKKLYAYATAGGNDTAHLHDSSGDDSFYGTPTYSYMTGGGFFNQAQAFDAVYAHATAGGSDAAYLYDSAGDESFYAYATYGYMTGTNFLNRAETFGKVYAYALAGGANDTAYLYDSPGNDTFRARSNWGELAPTAGGGFYNRVQAFDSVLVFGTNGGTNTLDVVAPLTYSLTPSGVWA